ncbi:MAG: diadenylate cyclase CdaA [Clostridia bacterium]|nr:diadenylate cyclase CdaA [Clostridia bacterium]
MGFSDFQNILPNISVTDILDILLVAFIIYKLLGFIQATRAWQLAKGIIFFILATLVSQWLHLYTLHWILSGLTTIGAIALVVLFQPELRRLLENLGGNRLRNFVVGADSSETAHMAKEICNAVTYLSKTRTGALIVIERNTTLDDVVETGTVINAQISDEILENVFYEGAPLHDGAVIIRRNRLHAAGCVLPLTQNKSLPKELGTRHRAGIGMSENSDCYSIIVSEETGIVSVAEGGVIRRKLEPEEIEKEILKMYVTEEDTNNPSLEMIKKMTRRIKDVKR